MTKRSDYLDNNNPGIFNYATTQGLFPDWALDSDMPSSDSVKELHNNAFANPYTREYPCHNKAATIMSAVWDAANHSEPELVTQNIKKMAAAHGISEEVENVYNHFEQAFMAKEASAMPAPVARQYALSIDHEGQNGLGVEGYYEITYPDDVILSAEKAASDYRYGNLGDVPMRKVASAIMDAVAHFNVPMDEIPLSVQTFGAPRIPDPYEAAYNIQEFAKSAGVSPDPYMAVVGALANMLEKASSVQEYVTLGDLAAERLVELNTQNRLFPKEASSPIRLIFCGPTYEEVFAKAASVVPIMGIPVPKNVVLALGDDVIDVNFSKEAAATIKEAKNTLNQGDYIDYAEQASQNINKLPESASRHLLGLLSEVQ